MLAYFFKRLFEIMIMQRICLSIMAALISVATMAQEKSADVDISVSKEGGGGWGAPWMWVVGGAVFILLLVALTRRTSKE
jgi:hypothetical protein